MIFINGPIGCGKSYDSRAIKGFYHVSEFDETFSDTIVDFYDGKIDPVTFQNMFINHTLDLQSRRAAKLDCICDSSIIQHLTFCRIRGIEVCEKEIIKRAFGNFYSFMIILKDMPWEYCRANIVDRARPYELHNLDELKEIHAKFTPTFLEICNDHKIPCLVIREPLTDELLNDIRNPTIDTETVGDVGTPRAFDFGIAYGDNYSQGFLIDGISKSELKEAYYPPNINQLIQPKASLENVQKLLNCCNKIYAYNAPFDFKALKMHLPNNYTCLWLMAVNYIVLQPKLLKKAKKVLPRTEKDNMRSRFEDLAGLICDRGYPPHPHTAKQDAVSEHYLRKYMIKNWMGTWDGRLISYGPAPWYLLNNWDKLLASLGISTWQVPA